MSFDLKLSSQNSPKLAIFWMLLSVVCFNVLTATLKGMHGSLPWGEMIFFRSFINLVLVAMLIWFRRERFLQHQGPLSKVLILLIVRGVCGFIGIAALFYGVLHLPLGVASLLSFSSPLFVILISSVWLQEKNAAAQIVLILSAFFSLFLLLDPRFAEVPLDCWVVAFSLGGSVCSALAYVSIKKISELVSPLAIVFAFMAIATTLSFPLMCTDFVLPNQEQWVALLIIGISSTVAQIAMTSAYRFGRASFVSVFNLLNPLLASTVGYFFYREQLSLLQVLGILGVVISIAFLALRESNGIRNLTKNVVRSDV